MSDRESGGPISFKWIIYRRRMTLGVKLAAGHQMSIHAAKSTGCYPSCRMPILHRLHANFCVEIDRSSMGFR